MQELKITRRHVWVAVSTHRLTEDQARRSVEDEEPISFTKDMLIGCAGPLCYECGGALGGGLVGLLPRRADGLPGRRDAYLLAKVAQRITLDCREDPVGLASGKGSG